MAYPVTGMLPARLWTPILALAIVLLTSCGYEPEQTGPMKEEQIHLDRGKVDHANIELDMGAGEMVVKGGAEKLVDGTFQFNVPRAEPKVSDSVSGTHATVTIQQPEHSGFGGHKRYAWDLQLNNEVLTDLAVNCGAGQARLELGQLMLRSLDVHMGAGQVDLDLRGTPSHDYDVNISGGVGQATVYLPQNVGIHAEAHGGLGSITVTGLEKHGDYWQNSLFDNSKVNVRLKVEGGIGEIRIIG